MPHYRLYHRHEGRFFHFDDIHAADDCEAASLAEPLRGNAESELWEGGRRVAAFEPMSEAADRSRPSTGG